jgi:general stress protein 26
MSQDIDNYEMVSVYRMSDAAREELLSVGRECVFNWTTRDGYPMGVIMSYVWADGRAWLTAGAHRHRISAIRSRPKVAVVVTSTGTSLGPAKTVTVKGRVVIHEDRATKEWFYPKFALHLRGEPEGAKAFEEMLDSPLRVVLEVIPEKFISYDGTKMMRHTIGQLSPDELAEPLESDTIRLQRELARRGLKHD